MTVVKVSGMSCQHCVGAVTKALEALDGIAAVKVDLDRGEVSFGGEVSLELVKEAIKKSGFEPG